MNVLVIDDSPQDTETIKEYLLDMGEDHIVDNGETLQAGIEKLMQKIYDVILLDLGLPDTTGIETVKTILKFFADNQLKKIPPIIVLTGLEDYAVGKEAMKLGAKDFLIKDETHAPELDRAVNLATYETKLPARGWFSKSRRRRKK